MRWGGTILDVETNGDRSCFVMLGRPLFDTSRPQDNDVSVGRFLACRDGFYDPAIFAKDRQLTVVGHVADFQTRTVGEHDYRYPTLDSDVLYLWPERDDSRQSYVDPIDMYPQYGYLGPRALNSQPAQRGGSGRAATPQKGG